MRKNAKSVLQAQNGVGGDFYVFIRIRMPQRMLVVRFVCWFDVVMVIGGQLRILADAKALLSCPDTLPIPSNAANHVVNMVCNRLIASKCLSEVK